MQEQTIDFVNGTPFEHNREIWSTLARTTHRYKLSNI